MKKWIISALIIGSACTSFGQDLQIGKWRAHHSYTNAQLLTASETKIFCAVENGLFSYDLTDQSLNKITKNMGLSSAGVQALHYSQQRKALAIGYESGIVDIIDNNGIHSISELKNLSDTTAKNIFSLTSYDNQILAATNYGIIVISLDEMGITDNYQSIGANATDPPIREVLTAHDSLYAITAQGIQYGSLSQNLLDFNNWKFVTIEDNFKYRNLASVGSNIYYIQNDTAVAQLVGDTSLVVWSSVKHINMIKELNGVLHALLDDELISISGENTSQIKVFDRISQPNDVIFKDKIWVADGLIGLSDLNENSLIPNGPMNDNITKMRVIDERLYAVYGPEAEQFNGSFDELGYNIFENGSWNSHTIDGFDNITDVVSYQNELVFSSAGKGLYFQNQDLILNAGNSSVLQNSSSYPHPIISALESKLSLWVSSYDNAISLLEYTSDEDWIQYPSSELGTSYPTNMHISNLDVLWIESSDGGLIAAYPEEDRYRNIGSAQGLASPQVYNLSIDVNDEVWVATEAGVTYFPEASYVFDDFFESGSALVFNNTEFYAQKKVSAIATDGGGRIWVSDEDGLSIFNNLLTKQEQFFTEDNSPLLSNKILQMEYNSVNGEMYILTDKGLVSYRSSSSEGSNKYKQVNIFPNPVRPDYEGLIGISGLVTNASVKITDINGNLIASIQANGGTASWDMRDYNSRKVGSGIYLIFSSNSNGSKTHIGKIAIVR